MSDTNIPPRLVGMKHKQATPTLWERLFVYSDGHEEVDYETPLTSIGDLLHRTMRYTPVYQLQIGCPCGNCPTRTEVYTDRQECINAQVKVYEGQSDTVHLDAGGKPYCGADHEYCPSGSWKAVYIDPRYWEYWGDRRCPECLAAKEVA